MCDGAMTSESRQSFFGTPSKQFQNLLHAARERLKLFVASLRLNVPRFGRNARTVHSSLKERASKI